MQMWTKTSEENGSLDYVKNMLKSIWDAMLLISSVKQINCRRTAKAHTLAMKKAVNPSLF